MGNMNYFGKTFKGTLWGGGNELKNDKNDGKGNKNDDKNKNKA